MIGRTRPDEPDERVLAAYAQCEQITTEQARNFAWGIKLLPTTKRRALSAVYAMARRIDDIGDGELPAAEKASALAGVTKDLAAPPSMGDDPVLVALHDAAQRLPIPLDAFSELIEGCDLDVALEAGDLTYRTFDDLLRYCRCVAGSVGRLSLGVFAPPLAETQRAEAARLADTLGLGLQITNILRDIREDLSMGRVYLPADDLALFGCELRLLPDGSLDPQDGRLAEVIRFEASRAAGLYDTGLRLLPLLDRRSAACCAAMAGIYRQLLTRIAADPTIVMSGRASLATKDKIKIALRAITTGKVAA